MHCTDMDLEENRKTLTQVKMYVLLCGMQKAASGTPLHAEALALYSGLKERYITRYGNFSDVLVWFHNMDEWFAGQAWGEDHAMLKALVLEHMLLRARLASR